MSVAIFVVLIYTVIVFTGGLIGYLSKGSVPSLFFASISSALLMLSLFGIKKEMRIGYTSALAVTLILVIFFMFRFIKTGSWMPAGMMSLISIFVLIYLIYKSIKFFK